MKTAAYLKINPKGVEPFQPQLENHRCADIARKYPATCSNECFHTKFFEPLREDRLEKTARSKARHRSGQSYRLAKSSSGSLCVIFKPPRPATRNFRPGDAFWSKMVVRIPFWAITSAARNPAGPAPMTTAETLFNG